MYKLSAESDCKNEAYIFQFITNLEPKYWIKFFFIEKIMKYYGNWKRQIFLQDSQSVL